MRDVGVPRTWVSIIGFNRRIRNLSNTLRQTIH